MKKGTSPALEVIVATHKMYVMPDDSLYQPLLVGSDFFLDQQKGITLPKHLALDNTGAHISSKNHNYSELTGLYWLCQNTVKKDTNPDSFYGLVHYRRYLSTKNKKTPLTKTELQNLINLKYEIILPKKRNYPYRPPRPHPRNHQRKIPRFSAGIRSFKNSPFRPHVQHLYF